VNGKFSGFGPPRSPRDESVVFFKLAEPSFLPGHVAVLEMLSDAEDGYHAHGFFSVVKVEGTGLRMIRNQEPSPRVIGIPRPGYFSWDSTPRVLFRPLQAVLPVRITDGWDADIHPGLGPITLGWASEKVA
jgi:hypothetical protein